MRLPDVVSLDPFQFEVWTTRASERPDRVRSRRRESAQTRVLRKCLGYPGPSTAEPSVELQTARGLSAQRE